jgi:hypothetical protein
VYGQIKVEFAASKLSWLMENKQNKNNFREMSNDISQKRKKKERERERESNDHNRCVQILIFPILIKYKHST